MGRQAAGGEDGVTGSELTGELERWREFGRATDVTAYDGVPIFANEFWTSRQRAAHSLHEISYRACFKPQLPRFFISRLTGPGDVVFDPFMGRGTTLLEAALLGRRPLGNDVNPLSRMLVEPRLAPPAADEVEARLAALALDDPVEHPEGFDAFFHVRTLNQICRLRAYLLERESADALDGVDRWIRMVAVNRLTGHSSGFFSVYTLPPNQAASIESQRRINARRGQTPEYRDVPRLILRKTRSLLRDVKRQTPEGPCAGFFRQPVGVPFVHDGPPVSLAVTSPPFMDVVNYRQDNWMRCWFAGVDPDGIGITQARRLEDWTDLVRSVLLNVATVTKPGGLFAFEVGEIRRGALLLDRVVADVARDTPWAPICIVVNEQAFTKTSNTWGVANNRGGTNTNRIVLLRRT
ncbi:MAG: site-specific DNA-methyltransferase [Acidobacteria bacterium]|nr:site-specific DNA-methyltransferase [Acidobacteriota bacterium]